MYSSKKAGYVPTNATPAGGKQSSGINGYALSAGERGAYVKSKRGFRSLTKAVPVVVVWKSQNSRKKQYAIQSGLPSYRVPASINEKLQLPRSRPITACVQKAGAHVEDLAPSELSKLVDRILSNEKFEVFNPHLSQEDIEGLRSSVPRIWPQRNVPVFAPFSATNKKLGYCQVRRNADEKVSCHRLTFAEYLASQEARPGDPRKAFASSLDVSHCLHCGM